MTHLPVYSRTCAHVHLAYDWLVSKTCVRPHGTTSSIKDEAGGTEMFVTDGASELLSSKCCFFLRNAKEGVSLDTARYAGVAIEFQRRTVGRNETASASEKRAGASSDTAR